MPSVTVTKNLTMNDIAQIVADNYTNYYFEDFLKEVHKRTSSIRKSNMVGGCRHFADTTDNRRIKGTVFCLTGDFDLGKKYWQKIIINKGGVVKSSISNNVDYLVIDNGKTDGTSSLKQKEAKKLGIPIIHVSEISNFN